MRQHVPPQQLWNEFHGDLEFEYDHEVYWPTLLKLCEEKHREQRARWIQGGKQYGESENYIKGGSTQSIGSKVVTASEGETAPTPVTDVNEDGAAAVVKEKEKAPESVIEKQSTD